MHWRVFPAVLNIYHSEPDRSQKPKLQVKEKEFKNLILHESHS